VATSAKHHENFILSLPQFIRGTPIVAAYDTLCDRPDLYRHRRYTEALETSQICVVVH